MEPATPNDPSLEAARRDELRRLEERIDYRFADLQLLDRALTHKSFAHETVSGSTAHNEPLEFLGDSVLGFLVAALLHQRDPAGDEGGKSRARAYLVSAASLAPRAAEIGLPALLRLGRGEEKTGGRRKTALWANAYEAVIAALYLDGGLPAARQFVERELGRDIETGWLLEAQDHKSALQEILQGRGGAPPEYRVLAEEGPSHRPRFRVRCVIDGRAVSEGEGPSKKLAQQEAARRALEVVRPPAPAD
jgi:ribonuclease III